MKSNTQRSKHDKFYLVGFVQVRNSHVFSPLTENQEMFCQFFLALDFFSLPRFFFLVLKVAHNTVAHNTVAHGYDGLGGP